MEDTVAISGMLNHRQYSVQNGTHALCHQFGCSKEPSPYGETKIYVLVNLSLSKNI